MGEFQNNNDDAPVPQPRVSLVRSSEGELFRQQQSARAPTAGASADQSDTLRDVILRVLRRHDLPVTVAGLAVAAGMSRSGFARRFVQAFGETPIAFLKKERLRRAAHLLGFTRMSVKSVAAKTGFASRTSFAREFKKAFGVPPSELIGRGLRPDQTDGVGSNNGALPLEHQAKDHLAEMVQHPDQAGTPIFAALLRTAPEEVRTCYKHAESCAQKAKATSTDALRKDFSKLQNRWLTLARSYELSIQLRDFIDYRKRERERHDLELREGMMLRTNAAALPDVFITQELEKRTPGKVGSLREKIALQALAALMADEPEQVLPEFVSLAMKLTGGVSVGLSLYEENPYPGIFRWCHLQGTLAQFVGAITPRNFSPCGIVLDLDAPVLTAHPERGYDWIAEKNLSLPEVLLVPLHHGDKGAMGTLWIVSDEDAHFHKEHARVLTELATFVAIALRMLEAGK